MPATSILSKINGEYSGQHEPAATKHYYLGNILIYSSIPGENLDDPRPVPQVRFCPARLARHSAIRQRLAVLRSHRQARKRLRNAKRFAQRSYLLAAKWRFRESQSGNWSRWRTLFPFGAAHKRRTACHGTTCAAFRHRSQPIAPRCYEFSERAWPARCPLQQSHVSTVVVRALAVPQQIEHPRGT